MNFQQEQLDELDVVLTPMRALCSIIRIPLCISLVVSKLMAKSVELRYQSSRGLHFDLLHCKRWLEDKRQGRKPPADFVPGLHDVSDVFSFPPRLYGRERDIQLIRKVYDITSKEMKNQVRDERGFVVLVIPLPLANSKRHEYAFMPNARSCSSLDTQAWAKRH